MIFTYHEVSWKTSMPVCKHQENKSGVQAANILLKNKIQWMMSIKNKKKTTKILLD